MKQLLTAPRFAQIILGGAGGLYLLSGLALLFAPNWFFQTLGYFPPFNRHYAGDLGAFLFPLGARLLWTILEPARRVRLIWVVAIASFLHAGNHIYDALLVSSPPIAVWTFQVGPLLLLAVLLTMVALMYTIAPSDQPSHQSPEEARHYSQKGGMP